MTCGNKKQRLDFIKVSATIGALFLLAYVIRPKPEYEAIMSRNDTNDLKQDPSTAVRTASQPATKQIEKKLDFHVVAGEQIEGSSDLGYLVFAPSDYGKDPSKK